MNFQETFLEGNYLINLEKFEDERGFFARCFCEKEFFKKGLNTIWLQINNSMSKNIGTLRGLHLQKAPHAEVKLIRCLKGKVWDVVVDLRKESKTFGKWFGATLSDENRTMMYIPKGFAHGFISLKPDSEILYLVSNFYTPHSEKTLLWNDPDVAISWPLQPSIISDKDNNAKPLMDFCNLDF
jgi:dTDP-4-dehydrorhamnose 3,5-epimerase